MIVVILIMLFTNFVWSPLKASFYPIETERTIWQPWTIDHTHQWEDLESQDQERLFFRRNEYFEDHSTLELRHHNWLTLEEKLKEKFEHTTPFPPLGYAIISKDDNTLIGALYFKLSEHNPSYMKFGYGFSAKARSQKYGKEVMKRLLQLSQEIQGQPVLQFKSPEAQQNFYQAWQWQGKWLIPDWSHLLSFFDPIKVPFQGLQACVDIDNPASLAVVYHQGMTPIGAVFDQMLLSNHVIYDIDIIFEYPSNLPPFAAPYGVWVEDILSRNPERINKAYKAIAEHFVIPSHGIYKRYNRGMREALMHLQTLLKSSSIRRITYQNEAPNLSKGSKISERTGQVLEKIPKLVP